MRDHPTGSCDDGRRETIDRSDVTERAERVSEPLRLLLAENAPTRAGARLALGGDVVVCAEADDGDQAIRSAKREQPDVALVGAGVAGGLRRIVQGICRAAPRCAVVVMASDADAEDMLELVRAGAVGYLPGAVDSEGLKRAVWAVAQRQAVVPRAMVADLLSELRSDGDLLSGREAQVLRMLRQGHSTAAIAARLEITPVTVRRHISELVRKLGVSSRADLVAGHAA